MGLNLSLPVSLGIIVAIVALGAVGMVVTEMMPTDIIMMMVVPSMLVFAGITFAIGVKHGEYRASGA